MIRKSTDQKSIEKSIKILNSVVKSAIFKQILHIKKGKDLIDNWKNNKYKKINKHNKMNYTRSRVNFHGKGNTEKLMFQESQTFHSIGEALRNNTNPVNARIYKYLENYNENVKFDSNYLEFDDPSLPSAEAPDPKMDDFEELKKLYHHETQILPLEEFEQGSYSYFIMPKLLKNIVKDEKIFKEIEWPKTKVEKNSTGIRSLREPLEKYTHENINSIIWVTCWIATYYYHREEEKCVHLIELITNLPKIKIGNKLMALIMKYITEAVSTGTPESVFTNFTYLQHHARNLISQSAYLKLLNKYILFTKKLLLGKELNIEPRNKSIKEKVETTEERIDKNPQRSASSLKMIKSSSALLLLPKIKTVINRPVLEGKMHSLDDGYLIRDVGKLLEPPKPPPLLCSFKSSEHSGQFSAVSKDEKIKKFFRTEEKNKNK